MKKRTTLPNRRHKDRAWEVHPTQTFGDGPLYALLMDLRDELKEINTALRAAQRSARRTKGGRGGRR